MARSSSIVPSGRWEQVMAYLEQGTILVVGPTGSGKTTFARWLVGQLARGLDRVALVDADPGQTSVGVPGCLGLALTGPWEAPAALWFVGSTSPAGHMLPAVVGAARLAGRARAAGARSVVIDGAGLVDGGAARVLQYHLALAARVDQVIAVEPPGGGGVAELAELLRGEGRPVQRLPASPMARERSRDERRRHRESRFAAHLQNAQTRIFSPRRIVGRDWQAGSDGLEEGTVLGLLDGEGYCLGLGVVEEVGEDRVAVRTPVAEVPVVRLQAGSFRLDPEGRELPASQASPSQTNPSQPSPS